MKINRFKDGMYIFLIVNIATLVGHTIKGQVTINDWYMIVIVYCFLGVVEAIEHAIERITNE